MSVFDNPHSRRDALRMLGVGAASALAFPMASACQKADDNTQSAVNDKAETPSSFSREVARFQPVKAPMAEATFPFSLPPLPYAFDALDAAIDAMTMEIHHDRHHAGYTKKLNAALEPHAKLHSRSIGELIGNLGALPEEVRLAVRNNGGGFYNHSLFWPMMSPSGGGQPSGSLADAINRDFGSFDEFRASFSQAAATVFGSGWAWLAADKANKLHVLKSANQDNPLTNGQRPILGIDVWEHAYYLKYQNKRKEYINNFWDIVNWDQCSENFGA